MAEDRVVAFPPDWEDDVPGIRARETMVDARRWAIVAYDPGARREEWYRDGHWGLVLDGAVEYEFDDGGERLGASEGETFFPYGRARAPRPQSRLRRDAAVLDRRPRVASTGAAP
jgi:hypothetical protein